MLSQIADSYQGNSYELLLVQSKLIIVRQTTCLSRQHAPSYGMIHPSSIVFHSIRMQGGGRPARYGNLHGALVTVQDGKQKHNGASSLARPSHYVEGDGGR